MARLEWTNSHSVFVPNIDDDHDEILVALAGLQRVLTEPGSGDWKKSAERLVRCFCDHFRSEERLMSEAHEPHSHFPREER